jgi:hypothetical protein
MKTGIIVYAAGDPPADWSEETTTDAVRVETGAHMVKLITRTTGHFDPHDAWFELTCRGMSHITCKMAEFSHDGRLRVTGRELRLCR